jgi:acyl-homoserine lactone acylase PvdQ
MSSLARSAIAAAVLALLLATTAASARAATWTPPPPTYQLNDAAAGDALSILPPGEHGLYNAADVTLFEANGTRPQGAQDQLGPYQNLLYNAQGLSDAQLPSYYDDESFGIPTDQVTRTETPSSTVNVVIYRDQHDVPHVYGDNQPDVAFGAGYAAAEDRLFEMDVLRHYGAGNLSAFLGPSCADEQMDHDSLLLGGYTSQQKQDQINFIATAPQYQPLGAVLVSMLNSYIAGINAYVAATVNPALLPADYAAAEAPPQPWAATDVIDIATLVGGIFGKGGGVEVANARMLQYLRQQFGNAVASSVFTDFKEQLDGDAPTTASSAFSYGIQGAVDPATTALPDDASAPLTGGPTNTTADCTLTAPSLPGLSVIASLLEAPHAMSNALLVDGAHSADGHPIAVFGPQVGYYTPQILMEEDLHATDGSYDVEGASFPGTNFLVELGRGRNFAWSATSAETDNVDQRLEQICDPGGGQPAANGTDYLFNGQCIPMAHNQFSETAFTKPGGQGAPVIITHDVYYTQHGVVQGWTSANNGQPVAVVNQRSTYSHEVDSGIGFMRWGMPGQTFDAQSWMQGAGAIQYTFNWFYVDGSTIAYYESGLLPIRPSNVDPNLPTWGTGVSEWQGFLDFSSHVHQTGSPTGYITSWNNRGAPQFSAADDKYSWGPVQRVQSLNQEIQKQFAAHGGKITLAQLVTAMETAAAVDLDGRQILPLLFASLGSSPEPPGVQAMLSALQQWLADGGVRRKASAGDSQYANTAAVAIMDQLARNLERAIFDPVFAGGGVFQVDGADAGYSVVPMQFNDWPHGNGTHHGSSYQDGWAGYVVKVLQQLTGASPATPFSADTTSRVCGAAGLTSCGAAIDSALLTTYNQLAAANGSTNVSSWTNDVASHNAGQTMPVYDDIQFVAVGIVGQPAIDWQNRPTFQQVVEFPGGLSTDTPELPAGSLFPMALVAAMMGGLWVRRRGRTGGVQQARLEPS